MPKAFHSRYYDPARLAKLGNLQLLARSVVEGYVSGLHRSPFKGFSAEFAEYREYLPGDDLKHFDWKVFARSDRKYVREYEEETNMTCTLVLDASGSMGYRSDGISKLGYGCYLAAALTYLMVQQRDQVGLVIADEAVRERIPPRWPSSATSSCSPALSSRATSAGCTAVRSRGSARSSRPTASTCPATT